MKKVLIVIGLLLGAVKTNADVQVFEVYNDSNTYNQVTVSSAIIGGGTKQLLAASLVGATTSWLTLMENRRALKICNEDSTANLRCMVSLSSTSVSGDLDAAIIQPPALSTSFGEKIVAGACAVYAETARNLDNRIFIHWCVNDSGTGTSKVGVIQVRGK